MNSIVNMIYFLILVSSFPVALIVIYFSNRSKNKTFVWIGRLCPPIALLLLIKIPFDFMTAIFWLFGVSVVAFSFLRIIYFFAKLVSELILKKVKKTNSINDQQSLPFYKLVRPCLCIIFFSISSKLVSMSIYSANTKALELAFETNEYVKKYNTCDQKKSSPIKNLPRFKYGEYGTKYYISYRCEPEKKRFVYSVRISIDESFSVIGNFDGSMKANFDYISKEVNITDKTDLEALANRKIK